MAVAQDLPIDVPEGYADDAARETEEAYAARYDETLGAEPGREAAVAQFAETRPTVICVMNETFADLSLLGGETWGYEGPSRYDSLDGTLASGSLAVSVLGGGTCNTEFEFLTGVPLAYVGDGKYPYSLYDLSASPSLARQFSELGYQTTAMHPNYATNWNRESVFEQLGYLDKPSSRGLADGFFLEDLTAMPCGLMETAEPVREQTSLSASRSETNLDIATKEIYFGILKKARALLEKRVKNIRNEQSSHYAYLLHEIRQVTGQES